MAYQHKNLDVTLTKLVAWDTLGRKLMQILNHKHKLRSTQHFFLKKTLNTAIF